MDASKAREHSVPDPSDYENPLERSSRWALSVRASAIRYAASMMFYLCNWTDPVPPAPSSSFWADSNLAQSGKGPSKIKVDVWTPPVSSTGTGTGPRAAVVCLHGGGWILGQGTDCSRWAGAATGALDAVVFSVNYRLAPSYPFPIPIEDAVDAILQISKRAREFGIDPDKIVLSGFSCGATTALASWIILQDPARFGYVLPSAAPRIRGLALFYPLLDFTLPRADKARSFPRPELALPKVLTDLLEACYIYPPIPCEERTDLRLSPGLMPDEMLESLPPVHLCLCEYDMLHAEGRRFADRLKQRRVPHSFRFVPGESHAWDSPPPLWPKPSVAVEYAEATQAIASWWGQRQSQGNDSAN